MGRRRGVKPESVRVPLTDGDWIDVKQQLNAGEQRHTITRMVKTMNAGEKTSLEPKEVGRSKILEYLLAWSLLGLDDQPIPYAIDQPEAVRAATLDALDFETYQEIATAVDRHDEANEQAREARKNVTATAGATPSVGTSPSVAG